MEKGKTNNPNGRPKGTPNRVTTTIRNWLVELINGNRERIEADLQALDPKDRLSFIEKLLPYLLPKVERADEVEGAAYSKDDIVTKPMFPNWNDGGETKAVQRWIDKDD